MRNRPLFAAVLLLVVAARGATADLTADRIAAAERFFRGVYGCEPSAVDDLAGDDIVVTYPIFETLFGEPALRGRQRVRDFAAGFCSRWADPEIIIHQAVGDAENVALLWSFRGRNVGSARPDREPTFRHHSWGGITFYRFDETGRIVAEIGEESEPGPMARWAGEGRAAPADADGNP